jgi:Peptidase family M23
MKFVLSGKYGELSEVRNWKPHNGIDLAIPEGETLRSITDGIVTKVFDGHGKIGKGIAIKTENGETHIFGHMSEVDVKPGQTIQAGDVLGESGATGHAHGAHLHFGVQNPDGSFVDPTPIADVVAAAAGNDQGFFSKAWEFLKDPGRVTSESGAEHGGLLWRWIENELHNLTVDAWNWFVVNLPDIMGYGAIAAGVFVILGSMAGKGGMIKPLGIYVGALILALCILGGT